MNYKLMVQFILIVNELIKITLCFIGLNCLIMVSIFWDCVDCVLSDHAAKIFSGHGYDQ